MLLLLAHLPLFLLLNIVSSQTLQYINICQYPSKTSTSNGSMKNSFGEQLNYVKEIRL